jgi:uncharacterized protein (DUF433 family)
MTALAVPLILSVLSPARKVPRRPSLAGSRAKIPLMATAAALAYPAYPHITEDPQVMSGSPCIAGTRVRVMDLVSVYKTGVPVDELQEYFSSRTLTLSEIHAALAYYFDHQEALEAAFAEEQRLGQQAERQAL